MDLYRVVRSYLKKRAALFPNPGTPEEQQAEMDKAIKDQKPILDVLTKRKEHSEAIDKQKPLFEGLEKRKKDLEDQKSPGGPNKNVRGLGGVGLADEDDVRMPSDEEIDKTAIFLIQHSSSLSNDSLSEFSKILVASFKALPSNVHEAVALKICDHLPLLAPMLCVAKLIKKNDAQMFFDRALEQGFVYEEHLSMLTHAAELGLRIAPEIVNTVLKEVFDVIPFIENSEDIGYKMHAELLESWMDAGLVDLPVVEAFFEKEIQAHPDSPTLILLAYRLSLADRSKLKKMSLTMWNKHMKSWPKLREYGLITEKEAEDSLTKIPRSALQNVIRFIQAAEKAGYRIVSEGFFNKLLGDRE